MGKVGKQNDTAKGRPAVIGRAGITSGGLGCIMAPPFAAAGGTVVALRVFPQAGGLIHLRSIVSPSKT